MACSNVGVGELIVGEVVWVNILAIFQYEFTESIVVQPETEPTFKYPVLELPAFE
jgi:poly(3-hydroxyalkanoate) synthetase